MSKNNHTGKSSEEKRRYFNFIKFENYNEETEIARKNPELTDVSAIDNEQLYKAEHLPKTPTSLIIGDGLKENIWSVILVPIILIIAGWCFNINRENGEMKMQISNLADEVKVINQKYERQEEDIRTIEKDLGIYKESASKDLSYILRELDKIYYGDGKS